MMMAFSGENLGHLINIKTASLNKYAPKAKKHRDDCPAVWIFNDWKPQTLQALTFVKS